MSVSQVLQQILQQAHLAQNECHKCLAIFDLDSTLFDLTDRMQDIVNLFAQDPERQAQFPQACQTLKELRILPTDWGLHEGLIRVGLESVEHHEFYRELHMHWAYHFFSDNFLHRDQPLPGAIEFVKCLEAEGSDIMYLTGRHEHRMRKGTELSLRNWGFPLDAEHVRLVLKPNPKDNDADFKLKVIQAELQKEAAQVYKKIWFFENEPVNLNLVARHCPEVDLIFIDTTHSKRESLNTEILSRIPHFEIDISEFEAFKSKNSNKNPER